MKENITRLYLRYFHENTTNPRENRPTFHLDDILENLIEDRSALLKLHLKENPILIPREELRDQIELLNALWAKIIQTYLKRAQFLIDYFDEYYKKIESSLHSARFQEERISHGINSVHSKKDLKKIISQMNSKDRRELMINIISFMNEIKKIKKLLVKYSSFYDSIYTWILSPDAQLIELELESRQNLIQDIPYFDFKWSAEHLEETSKEILRLLNLDSASMIALSTACNFAISMFYFHHIVHENISVDPEVYNETPPTTLIKLYKLRRVFK